MKHQTFAARLLGFVRSKHSRIRILLARATGSKIGRGCTLGRGCDLELGVADSRRGGIQIGENCELADGVIINPYGGFVQLGQSVYLGTGVVIFGHGGVEIGDDALISMHCRILSSNHTIPNLGTHIRWSPDVARATKIGRDVWLGAGVTVLGGVTIGDGCAVGAGAVVTADLAPASIAVGIPARVVRRRSFNSGS
jgi:acetyltransferase-like isoleucine patch superfamily enzyme